LLTRIKTKVLICIIYSTQTWLVLTSFIPHLKTIKELYYSTMMCRLSMLNLTWAGFHNQGLIPITSDRVLNDSLCCSYKYNWLMYVYSEENCIFRI